MPDTVIKAEMAGLIRERLQEIAALLCPEPEPEPEPKRVWRFDARRPLRPAPGEWVSVLYGSGAAIVGCARYDTEGEIPMPRGDGGTSYLLHPRRVGEGTRWDYATPEEIAQAKAEASKRVEAAGMVIHEREEGAPE